MSADHAADDGDVLGRLGLEVDVGLGRGLVAARVDDDQLEAALLGVVEPLPGVGLRQAGGDRDQRVRADDHAHVGGGRALVQRHPHAHEPLGDGLARLVDRRGDPPARVAERLPERVASVARSTCSRARTCRCRGRPRGGRARRRCAASCAAISSMACTTAMGVNEPSGWRARECSRRSGWVCISGRARPLMQLYPW